MGTGCVLIPLIMCMRSFPKRAERSNHPSNLPLLDQLEKQKVVATLANSCPKKTDSLWLSKERQGRLIPTTPAAVESLPSQQTRYRILSLNYWSPKKQHWSHARKPSGNLSIHKFDALCPHSATMYMFITSLGIFPEVSKLLEKGLPNSTLPTLTDLRVPINPQLS